MLLTEKRPHRFIHLTVLDVLLVGQLYDLWSSLELTVLDAFVQVSSNQQPLHFLGVIAQEKSDDEETQKSDDDDCIGSSRSSHLYPRYHQHDKHRDNVQVYSEQTVSDLAVVIKSTVRT